MPKQISSETEAILVTQGELADDKAPTEQLHMEQVGP